LVALPFVAVFSNSAFGHGVPEELQGKRVQVQNEQFSDNTAMTGDILTVTGELVNRENNTLSGLSLSLSIETEVPGKSWEITYRSLGGETSDVPAAGRVPFEMKIVPLKPGIYHVHTRVDIDNDKTPTLGRGQTVSVTGAPIATLGEAMSCSQEQILKMARNTTAALQNATGMANQTAGAASGLVSEPQIAVAENRIHVAWSDFNNTAGNFEIYYKKSDDMGRLFNKTVNLSNTTSDSLYPQVLAFSNNVFVIWEEASAGRPTTALCVQSSDYGDTFGKPFRQSNAVLQ
jgi:methane/ammonia monooxygenase subunit B